MSIKYLLSYIKEALFSSGCIVCGEPIDIGAALKNPVYRLCPKCREKWRNEISLKKSDDNILTIAAYSKKSESIAKAVILKAKKENYSELPLFIAYELSTAIKHLGLLPEKEAIITYAPRSQDKLEELGFDHMEYAAKELAKICDIHFYRAFSNVHGREQKKLGASGRKENAENSIILRKNAESELNGKNVIIIDDVFTTGATLRRCRQLAVDSGASSVICATFAKTEA